MGQAARRRTAPHHLALSRAQRPAAPPVVAIDIEDLLIWTYRDQRADRVIGAGLGLYRQESEMDGIEVHTNSACGVAQMMRIGELGLRIDGGGPSAGKLHIDAELVHEAVMRLERPTALLVMRHARTASRPDQTADVDARPTPVMGARGRVRVHFEDWDKGRRYGWCPISWTVALASRDAARLEYRIWRRALAVLALHLSHDRRMTRHRAVAPAAPAEPKSASD